MVDQVSVPDTGAADIGYFDEAGLFQPLQQTQDVAPNGQIAPLDIASLIPGGDVLTAVLTLIKEIFGGVEQAVKDAESAHPLNFLGQLLPHAAKALPILTGLLKPTWDLFTEYSVGGIYQALLEGGMGLDTTKFDGDAHKAMQTVDTMLGFAAVIEVVGGAIDGVGKGLLGGRWGEGISKMLEELPNELGLSWVLGLTIEKAFDAALGNYLEEAIRAQKQNMAPEWPVVRTLLRQHQISPADLQDRLKASGFNAHWSSAIEKLADAQLPLGDIQNAYLHGLIDSGKAREYIDELGFSKDHADILERMYISKAETESSRFLVSTARGLFRRRLITATQYRDILSAHNYPEKEIDDDIAAVQLEIENGRLELSVTTIKAEYLRGTHDASAAIMKLVLVGYSQANAAELVASWDLPPTAHEHGLSQARILSYYMSGVLDAAEARTQLQRLHLYPDVIDFLLAHPSASAGARRRQLTPGLVTQAFMDHVVTQEQLPDLFAKANVDPAYVQYYVDVAKFKFSRRKPGAAVSKTLSEGQIADLWAFGLFDQQTAIEQLTQIGYSADDAQLLLDIKNKGPIRPPAPPAFPDLAAAIAYMEAHGFDVHPPPNPLLLAAESELAQAGYTWTPTPTPTQQPPNA